jgi:hypothetical protein
VLLLHYAMKLFIQSCKLLNYSNCVLLLHYAMKLFIQSCKLLNDSLKDFDTHDCTGIYFVC